MPVSKLTAAVIGGGIGGLATAALLAHKGYAVTLYEKNPQLGGRAMQTTIDGFVFDRGPSWYLMPEVFERYFALFGHQSSDFYTLHKLQTQYRVYWDMQGDHTDISANLAQNLATFEAIEPGCSAAVTSYLEKARYQYEVSMKHYLYTSFDKISDYLRPSLLVEGIKLHLFESLDTHTRRYFSSEKLRKILQYTNVFLGGSPKKTPALFSLMSHIDFHQGVFYPMGGMYETVKALITLCEAHHVTFQLNSPISHLDVADGRATLADIVVSNADYAHTEMHLLDPVYQSYPKKYWERATIAPSAFILYLGVQGNVKNLVHHNLFFDHDWERHFDQIFSNPGWPEDPSYYVCCPSKTDPSVAPAGDENIFVLVPVAPGLTDDDATRERFADKIITHLEQITGDSIRERITTKLIHSHRDFISLFHAYRGTALGLSHTLFQSAFFRPKNKSAKVSNLYHVGQYTLPGIGVPMCLIGAEVVTEKILRDFPQSTSS